MCDGANPSVLIATQGTTINIEFLSIQSNILGFDDSVWDEY